MQNNMTTGWKGFLSFSFVEVNDKTVVKDKKHFGPLVLQRPYYQEKDRPSVLVLHPPGGVVGGDSLELNVSFQPRSKGMVSTPAATKFYRSDGRLAIQNQTINLSENVEVEWLPQETLFFNQSVVRNSLKLVLDRPGNKFIAWDIVGLGRPLSGEGFELGELHQSFEVWVEDRLVFVDRLKISPQSAVLNSDSALAGHSLFATALFYQDDPSEQKRLLEMLQAVKWPLAVGVTQLDSLVVMRVLASELDEIKQVLFDAWKIARPVVFDVPVVKPRIWNT
ncbi:MAG: urease accessory protein UreD [Thiomicrorhabdus chilensis]|uniref:urease accessory protein UreD n=1 Tax=Thiomicrorhabdus chilensis TaxID=63656 RepID=UPI00299E3456|nr:urease accessory protein UreD [Thiomicrorhabdus chilensis]MDX1347690.1 urease accessory protein UreD [Thiomicrorhabdus chilensis]